MPIITRTNSSSRHLLSAALVTLLLSPALLRAQTGNGSDVTGPATTGSTPAGGVFVVPPGTTGSAVIDGNPVSAPLVIVSLITQVNGGGSSTLPGLSGSTFTFSAGTGANLSSFTFGGVGFNTVFSALGGLLSTASAPSALQFFGVGPVAPAMTTTAETQDGVPQERLRELVSSLSGILKQPTPRRITKATEAYNRVVEAAPATYLRKPPEMFVAVRALLDGLVGLK